MAFVIVAVLGYLYWMARQGDRASIAILAVLAAVVLILLGVGIAVLFQWMAARREETAFIQNAKENMAIMASMQRVQNAQNVGLLRQAREMQRALPAPEGETIDGLEYDDAVFAELSGE
jgi:hypothetical protein